MGESHTLQYQHTQVPNIWTIALEKLTTLKQKQTLHTQTNNTAPHNIKVKHPCITQKINCNTTKKKTFQRQTLTIDNNSNQ
jgi:hypothetical protein